MSYPDGGYLVGGNTDYKTPNYSNGILVKLKKQAEKSEPLEIIAKPLFVEPWGLGLRKGEPAFKEAVNKALSALDASGEADTIFTKWFGPSTVYDMKRDFKIDEIKD